MTKDISNNADVLDSRDVIARIEELQEERDQYPFGEDSDPENDDPAKLHAEQHKGWAEANPEDAAELAALESLAAEAEGYADDWKHGATLVRDTYFTDYAMEMLQDIGDLPKNIPPYVVIDKEATAQNIRADYTSVDFDGVEYWVR